MMKTNILPISNREKQSFFISCRESRIENPRSFYGSFFLGPFHSGQSLTVANALRRTLLSELKGLAITSAEIQGAVHEYSILPGVRESVLDILLNLKEIVLKASKDSSVNFRKTQVAFVQVRGPGVVRAKDIKLPIGLQCVDPEQYIATVGDEGVLNIQLKIQQGKNYTIQKPSTFLRPTNWKELHLRQLLFRKLSEMKQNSNPTHSGSKPLSIDAVFMPITKVNYTIQVEDNLSIALEKNFQNSNSFDMQKNQASSTPKSIREKTNHIIVLDIWTNGSIHPREALYSASNKLLKLFATIEKIQIRNSLLFKPFVGSEKTYETVLNRLQTLSASSSAETASGIAEPTNSFTKIKFLSKNAKEYWTLKKLQITEIQNLNISLRPYTCLQRADIKTLYDLVNYSKSDLLKIKNLGFKSLNEIDQSLIALGIQMQEI